MSDTSATYQARIPGEGASTRFKVGLLAGSAAVALFGGYLLGRQATQRTGPRQTLSARVAQLIDQIDSEISTRLHRYVFGPVMTMSLSYLSAARITHKLAERLSAGTLTLDDEGRHRARLPPPLPHPYTRPLTLLISLEAAMYYSDRSQADALLVQDLLTDEEKVRRAINATEEDLIADPTLRTIRQMARAGAADSEIKPRKRPGLDNFLAHLAPQVELIVYTDQPIYNAEPLIERMDQDELLDYTLTRENGLVAYDMPLKDLTRIGRDLRSCVVIDCKPATLQTDNLLLVSDWDGNRQDSDLLDVVPFIEYLSRHAKQGGDVRDVLRQYKGKNIPALYRQRRAGGAAQGQQAAKKSGWF